MRASAITCPNGSPTRGEASGAPLAGRFEDGLFQYSVAPDGSRDAFEIDRGEVRSYARRVRE